MTLNLQVSNLTSGQTFDLETSGVVGGALKLTATTAESHYAGALTGRFG